MHSRIGCICLIFLHYVFSNVSTNCLGQRMQSHAGCTCLAFLHCVFSNVSSNCLNERMQNHIGYICLTSPRCVFSYGTSENLDQYNAKSHWLNLCDFSQLCVFKCVFKWLALIDAKPHCIGSFVWLFSTVGFQMSPQINGPKFSE